MRRFDRTGTEPDHIYNMPTEVLIYTDDVTGRRELHWEGVTSETDPYTVRICVTRFHPDLCGADYSGPGKVLLWGEDSDGDRCWLREDDEQARGCYDKNVDLLEGDLSHLEVKV